MAISRQEAARLTLEDMTGERLAPVHPGEVLGGGVHQAARTVGARVGSGAWDTGQPGDGDRQRGAFGECGDGLAVGGAVRDFGGVLDELADSA